MYFHLAKIKASSTEKLNTQTTVGILPSNIVEKRETKEQEVGRTKCCKYRKRMSWGLQDIM